MKVLQINSVINSGSTGRIAEDIGKVVIANHHESYIAYGVNDRESSSNRVKIGNKTDILEHKIQSLLLDKHGLASKKATSLFVKQLQEINPDVIGIHNLHGYYINYEILFEYIKKHNKPVIWTFHDCWAFTGHCAYFERTQCEKWKTHCKSCPQTTTYPKSLVIDRSFRNFEDKKEAFLGVEQLQIITPSHWLKNLVKASFLKEYPVSVIHNGIDLNVFKPSSKTNDESKIVIGVASIWDERKGLKDFIKLRSLLPQDIQIVLIGLSTQQIKTLPEGIKGIQRTENVQELAEWYSKASVFVNPTYIDNFPTTNIEALACGTPVVTYRTGGSPEAIDDRTGGVVEKGDIKGLKDMILQWINKEDVSPVCRKRAELNFDKNERYQDYLALYEKFSF